MGSSHSYLEVSTRVAPMAGSNGIQKAWMSTGKPLGTNEGQGWGCRQVDSFSSGGRIWRQLQDSGNLRPGPERPSPLAGTSTVSHLQHQLSGSSCPPLRGLAHSPRYLGPSTFMPGFLLAMAP